MSSSVDPSTLTINTGDNAQGTFTFTNLQWNGNTFIGDAYNSLTKESGTVSGSETWGAISANVILPGQSTEINTSPPPAMQAELNSYNNVFLSGGF